MPLIRCKTRKFKNTSYDPKETSLFDFVAPKILKVIENNNTMDLRDIRRVVSIAVKVNSEIIDTILVDLEEEGKIKRKARSRLFVFVENQNGS